MRREPKATGSALTALSFSVRVRACVLLSSQPLLTEAMLDAHEIPQPYMLGVHSKHLPLLHALDEVLIVDLDHDVLRCSVVLTPLPIKDGRELWMNWRRSYERIAIQKIDQSADCRVEQMERWSRQHNAFPTPMNNSSNGLPPLHGAAASPYPSPATSLAQQLSSQVTMSTLAGHARRSSFITAGSSGGGGGAGSVPSTGGLLAVAPPHPSLSPAAAPAVAGGALFSPSAHHAPHQPHQSGATPIASPFPATAYNLDEEVYAALLRFYSDLLSGYSKFLFFISDVPFFNAQGFLSARVAKDPAALGFFQRFVASRAFDVFIEEESAPDAYHEFLAAGTPLNRIQSILMQDFGTCERVLAIPDPSPVTPQQIAAVAAAAAAVASTDGTTVPAAETAKPPPKPSSARVEVESCETRDEVLQAVVLLDQDRTTMISGASRGSVNTATALAATLSSSVHFPVTGTPFAQPLRSDLIADATAAHELVSAKGAPAPPAPSALAPPLRSFHWEGLEADLLHFNFSLLQPTPRKPKSLAPEEREDGSNLGGATAAAAAALVASANPGLPASGASHGGIPSAGPMVRAPSAPTMHDSSSSSSGADSLSAPPRKKLLQSYPSVGHLDTTSAAHQDHRVKQLLSQIFSSHTLSKEEMKEFRALMIQAPNCRRLFASILAQPKHHGSSSAGGGGAGASGGGSGGSGGGSSSTSLCLTPIGFEQLSLLVIALLDASYSAHDYLSALGALESATVYYWEAPGGSNTSSGAGSTRNHGPSRVYLESAMKSHRIWQDMDFWRAGLAHALSARAIKQGQKGTTTAASMSAPSTPSASASGAAASASPASPTGSAVASASADHEFLLQWLISAAHQMMANQVPFARVDQLIKELSHTHKLSAEGVATITAFLAKTKEAMQFWNA